MKYVFYIIIFIAGFVAGLPWCDNAPRAPLQIKDAVSLVAAGCRDAAPASHKIEKNGVVVEQGVTYFSHCVCAISYNGGEPIGWDAVDALEFQANTPDAAYEKCNDGCFALCQQKFSERPDFSPQRW